LNVAGVATMIGLGTTDPDPVKTIPEDEIVNVSQQPSVENVVNVTKIYPVALFTTYLQFKLFVYVSSSFV